MPKKVADLPIEIELADGSKVVDYFNGEFNNARFGGDITSLEGTFSGVLTADAVDAVKNLTIAGRSVARTWVAEIPEKTGFDDDSVYRDVVRIICAVPAHERGTLLVTCQYDIDDGKWDNDGFPCRHRVIVNDKTLYTSTTQPFGNFYRQEKRILHVVSGAAAGGNNVVAVQWAWDNIATNMYAIFRNIRIRADFIKK